MKLLKNKKFWAGLIISAVCIYIFLYGTSKAGELDTAALGEELKNFNYWYLVPALFFILLSMVFRCPRWRILLQDHEKKISLWCLLRINFIGFMGNSVFPLRFGEVMRVYFLSRQGKLPFPFVLATIGLERVFDLFGIMLSLIFVLMFPPFDLGPENKELLQSFGQGVFVLFLVMVGGIVCLLKFPETMKKIIANVCGIISAGWAEKVTHLFDVVVEGFHSLKSWQAVCWTLFYTLLVWITITLSEYFIILGFGFETNYMGAAFVMIAICAAVSVPSAPGYFGVYHVGCQKAMELLGAKTTLAQAIAIVMHGYQWLSTVIAGLISLPLEGLSLSDLKKTPPPEALDGEESTGTEN